MPSSIPLQIYLNKNRDSDKFYNMYEVYKDPYFREQNIIV